MNLIPVAMTGELKVTHLSRAHSRYTLCGEPAQVDLTPLGFKEKDCSCDRCWDYRAALIQKGELPAENVLQLVDALRQNVSAAGADLSTLSLLIERYGSFEPDVEQAVREARERLAQHLHEANAKLALALSHYGDQKASVRPQERV